MVPLDFINPLLCIHPTSLCKMSLGLAHFSFFLFYEWFCQVPCIAFKCYFIYCVPNVVNDFTGWCVPWHIILLNYSIKYDNIEHADTVKHSGEWAIHREVQKYLKSSAWLYAIFIFLCKYFRLLKNHTSWKKYKEVRINRRLYRHQIHYNFNLFWPKQHVNRMFKFSSTFIIW